jgi:hypothetical protein
MLRLQGHISERRWPRRIERVAFVISITILTCQFTPRGDLGIGDPTATWFWQITGQEIRIIDHYENSGQAIPHYVKEIQSQNYKQGIDWVPHDAKIRSAETGRTRVETLIFLGARTAARA